MEDQMKAMEDRLARIEAMGLSTTLSNTEQASSSSSSRDRDRDGDGDSAAGPRHSDYEPPQSRPSGGVTAAQIAHIIMDPSKVRCYSSCRCSSPSAASFPSSLYSFATPSCRSSPSCRYTSTSTHPCLMKFPLMGPDGRERGGRAGGAP
jgi:hypothetical protein